MKQPINIEVVVSIRELTVSFIKGLLTFRPAYILAYNSLQFSFPMQNSYGSLLAYILVIFTSMAQENKIYKVHTVTFYNLENLFDTEDDPLTYDNDRTPQGKDHWTEEIYKAKLNNMAQVISEIGKEFTGNAPTLIGVCEIENRKVLEDLLDQNWLSATNYGILHFDSFFIL